MFQGGTLRPHVLYLVHALTSQSHTLECVGLRWKAEQLSKAVGMTYTTAYPIEWLCRCVPEFSVVNCCADVTDWWQNNLYIDVCPFLICPKGRNSKLPWVRSLKVTMPSIWPKDNVKIWTGYSPADGWSVQNEKAVGSPTMPIAFLYEEGVQLLINKVNKELAARARAEGPAEEQHGRRGKRQKCGLEQGRGVKREARTQWQRSGVTKWLRDCPSKRPANLNYIDGYIIEPQAGHPAYHLSTPSPPSPSLPSQSPPIRQKSWLQPQPQQRA